MDTQKIIFIVLIVVMFLGYAIIPSLLRYKGIQQNNEKHSKFLSDLKLGDKIVLNSGIFGKLVEKNEEVYSIEISKGVIVEVLSSSIIGRK
jgi:preprotein translocase subunit YajC